MIVHICLVSSSEEAQKVFRTERDRLIPKEIREHPKVTGIGATFSMTCFDPKRNKKELSEYLLEREKDEAIIILWDEALGDAPSLYSSACFVINVSFNEYPKTNYKNYFSGKFSKTIRTFSNFFEIINDGANQQVMLLPFRNFKAQQLIDLKTIFATQKNDQNFINSIDSLVTELKQRRRPHRKSNSPELHFFDDEEKMFRYGSEKHAILATGAPHSSKCVLIGTYRFGKKIPVNRHFNLTKEHGKETKISGTFLGCHDEFIQMRDGSHINIFCNDYIA